MTLREDFDTASADPGALETLYRTARERGDEAAFSENVRRSRANRPGDVLLEAWAHRLDLLPDLTAPERSVDRRWTTVILSSVLLGLATALLAGGKPPVPVPGEADPWYWTGWGPMMALGFLAYLARTSRPDGGLRPFGVAAACVAALALYSGFTMGGRAGDAADMTSVHLLFAAWCAVGAALLAGHRDRASQAYAYLVKTAEIVLTGGLFFASGLVFVGLTVGIFQVLGITIPERTLVVFAGFGVGAIPLLALGTSYAPSVAPTDQDWHTGLARTMRIIARVLLPLALGVLIVYVGWFIPVHFGKAFEEREALIVYNATILAVTVLLTVAVSGPLPRARATGRDLFRIAVLTVGALTLVLNVYALAAVVTRTIGDGLTPNRFTVIGWNLVTLVLLGGVGFGLLNRRTEAWIAVLRESTGRFAPVAVVWVVVLLLVLPFLG